MSTYLIAFVISEFTCSAWNMPEVNSVNKVCSRAQKEDTRRWAVEVSPKLLSSLNAYTGIPYTSSMKKVDQVAIPDFRSGAMENWGLITYREAMFLYDPKEDQSIDKQTVARVIAHELAHSWFGNLVTLAWWSEVFLNEGFARYFEHKAVNEVFPDWELDKQFVVATLQSALATDDLQSIQALQSEVITPAQIDAKFKADTSYGKGGSILRMVEHFMGSEQFKSGIQKYLMLNQYSNVEPSNLWAALSINVDNTVSNLPQSLANVMENWITKAGYPLITVTKTSNNVIELKQERFLFSGSDTTTKWYVPVTYTTSVDENKFQKTSTQLWMQPDKDAQIQLPEGASWIILNNQQTGFYRVNYDDTLWAEIEKALKSDSFDDIGELNRAQIVDDLFSLAKANKIPYSKALKVIKFISNDVSYYTWFSANRGFNFLLDKIGFESDLGRAIKDDVLQQLEKVYQSVPPSTIDGTNHLYTLKQTLVVALACRLGHPECIEMTKNHFTAYKNQGTKPPKDLRRIVYCGALRYSADNADWDFLWNAFVKSTSLSEGVIFLSGLGCSKDTDILKRYLLKTVTDSEIRRQDRQTVFVSVVNGNPSNFDTALDFLIEHQKEIDAQYGTMRALPSLLDLVASRITDETQLNKLKNLVTNLDAEHKESGNAALEKAEANLKWKKQVERDLQNYYGIPSDDTDSAVTSTVSLIIVTICSVIDVIGF
ncbi:unnamed protein product [Acanthoscelides obtectus]|uniref:Aminopeptidase N n=3 Tax=Acanthoscelides obtectus TaxID=200917 RepID=A0A9P0L3A0_ACAOB|nr:unnamed protein product [Acanthoscelides obtectus]CAK1664709.1 Aminopeptidase N [Acanthoscelides obtectus]